MGGLQIAQAAVLDEGDAAPRELELQQVRVVPGAGEHRLLAQEHPALARRQHPVTDLDGLLGLIAAEDELRALAPLAGGSQRLGEADLRLGGDGVGDVEQRLGGAVVALQQHRAGAGEPLRETEDVIGGCRPEAVDGLEVVADRGDRRAVAGQRLDDLDLQLVDVLVLVDEHMVKAGGQPRPGLRVARQRAPEDEQVVEIEDAERPLARRVAAKQAGQVVGVLGAPRKRLVDHLAHRPLGVDRPRIDVDQRLLAGKPAARLGMSLFLAHEVDHVRRVPGIEQAEVRAQSQGRRVGAHEPVSHRRERCPRRSAGRRSRDGRPVIAAARAIISRAARRVKVKQQHPLGRDAVLDQPRHPGAQRRRLARARPGEHQQMTAGVLGRGPLLGVEGGAPGGRRCRCRP